MTTGMTRLRRVHNITIVVLVLYGAILASDLAAADEMSRKGVEPGGNELTLDRLTALLAQVPERRSHFKETYYSSLFREPVTTKGTLTFTAPSRVEKHVLAPFEERYLADGDSLIVEQRTKGTLQKISLEEHPLLKAFVEGFRAVLAGDRETLRQFYDVRVEGEQSRWILTLRPLDQVMRGQVKSIRFTGKDDSITSIEIRESNGDRSEMVITRQER